MSAQNMRAGVILLDKPRGISSAQAIGRVKFALKPPRIGHAGTLDPLATGLLVCLIGGATRLAHYAEAGAKTYSGVFRFGVTTDSDDSDGKVISETAALPGEQFVHEAAKRFFGTIQQIPPQISAVKVQGKRAYERVRECEHVTLSPRTVTIDELTLKKIDEARYRFLVRCSKGTYIRSIARDLGMLLDCGGIVEELRREASFPFSVAGASMLDEVTADDILPWELLFPAAPRVTLSKSETRSLAGGDQRFLASDRRLTLTEGLTRTVSGEQPVTYCSDDASAASGLLLWNGESLKLGVHLNHEH